jgi:peptide/nickel transport system permease protein
VFRPHTFAVTGKRDPKTFKKVYEPDPTKKVQVKFFVEGYEYKLLGLFPANRHLFGVEGAKVSESLFFVGHG